MAGTSSTRACATCRQRKTKCDRALPSCSACVASGWKCNGYSKSWHFRHVKASPSSDESELAFQATRRNKELSMYRPLSSASVSTLSRHSSYDRTPTTSLPANLTSRSDHLQSKFVMQLRDNPHSICAVYSPTYPFLDFLCSRIGATKALDDAIHCICLVQIFEGSSSSLDLDATLQAAYHAALCSIRTELQSGSRNERLHVLAAIMLLQLFEQSTNFEAGNWVHHAGGVIRLIETLGPDFFVEDLGISILLSQIGRINFECLRTGRSSFLGTARWQVVFDRCRQCEAPQIKTHFVQGLSYHKAVSLLPDILCRYSALGRSRTSGTEQYAVDLTVQSYDSDLSPLDQLMYQTSEMEFLQSAIAIFERQIWQWREENAAQFTSIPSDTHPSKEETDNNTNKKPTKSRKTNNKPSSSTTNNSDTNRRLFTAQNCATGVFLLISSRMSTTINHWLYSNTNFTLSAACLESKTCPISQESSSSDDPNTTCMYLTSIAERAHKLLKQIQPQAGRLLGSSLLTTWKLVDEFPAPTCTRAAYRYADTVLRRFVN